MGLLLLVLVAVATGLILAEKHTRIYRERAAVHDLAAVNALEIPSVILDRNGKEIGRIFVQNRSVIPIDKVPERFIDTLITGEDSRFWKHKGVDPFGIVRAAFANLEDRRQGASTITQQLARNAYNLREQARQRGESEMDRKLEEIFLAMRIEKKYKKREILEFYLNRIYCGSGFYGIRSASLGYFGMEPMDLTTPECASLVTLIKNPTGRSPLNNPDANLAGRNYVLSRMVEEGRLSAADATRYQAEPLVLNPKPLRRGTSHLYERVADGVARILPEEELAEGGFKIHTTILKEAQDAAQEALESSLSRAEAVPGYAHPKRADFRRTSDASDKPPEYLQGAVLMIDHDTGEVLAHIGGRDYAQAPFDFVESGRRPLGTAFFPFLYAAGLAAGHSPAAVVADEAMDNRSVMVGGREGILGEWGMETASPTYDGQITVRRAFEQSKIAATVRFGTMVGLERIVQAASAFGLLTERVELLPRICVGWEGASMKQLVRAMSVFPRQGRSGVTALAYIDRIEDASGRYRYYRSRPAQPTTQVIDDATAWQVHSLMAGSLARGSSQGAVEALLERPFPGAGKGGSTHDFADAWFVGYNKRVTCGVWTGFLQPDRGAIYPGAFSRDLAMPVWQAAMNAIAPSFGGGNLEVPESVVELPVCAVSGQRSTRFCQEMRDDPATGKIRAISTAVNEFFRRGTEPMAFCSTHSGGAGEGLAMDVARFPALSEMPVIPVAPALIGDDPYHCESPSATAVSRQSRAIRHRTNVLDSLDVGDGDVRIELPRPPRAIIDDD